ncbi:hypothetical protein ACHAPJ_012460 [Fusarium lateritium]
MFTSHQNLYSRISSDGRLNIPMTSSLEAVASTLAVTTALQSTIPADHQPPSASPPSALTSVNQQPSLRPIAPLTSQFNQGAVQEPASQVLNSPTATEVAYDPSPPRPVGPVSLEHNQALPPLAELRHRFAATRDDTVRRNYADRSDDNRAYLDSVWPGWLPQDIRSSCHAGSVPRKVIDHLTEIVKALQVWDDFADFSLDSLWSPSGIFRQALSGKKKSTHFTVDLAFAAKKRILSLLREGGLEALRAAQAVDSERAQSVDSQAAVKTQINAEIEEAFPTRSSSPAPSDISDHNLEFTFDLDSGLDMINNPFSTITRRQISASQMCPPSFTPDVIRAFAGPASHASRVQSNTTIPTADEDSQLLADTAPMEETDAGLAVLSKEGDDRRIKPKRRRSPSPAPSTTNAKASRQRTATQSGLTSAKILHQLRRDVRLTDDVLNLLCRAVKIKYSGKGSQVLVKYPLWFYRDDHAAILPSALQWSKDTRLICFPIHLPGDHWALGSKARFEDVSARVRAWLNETGYKDKELTTKSKKCARQLDAWSYGVHVVASLSMILQGKICPEEIDIQAEKAAQIRILRSLKLEDGDFSQEELTVLRGLDREAGEEQRVTLDSRLSSCTMEDLERHLAMARARLDVAQKTEREARLQLVKVQGRMEMREETRQRIEQSIQRLQDTLNNHASRANSTMPSRRNSLAGVSDFSLFDESLMDQLDQSIERRIQRDQTTDHNAIRMGVNWLVVELQQLGDGLDAEITAAEQQMSAAERGLEMATLGVEKCEKSIEAKDTHDQAEMAKDALRLIVLAQENDRKLWAEGKLSIPE